MNKKLVDKLSYDVLGAAIEVHKEVGPGLVESLYHEFIKHELNLRNLEFETEMIVPVEFKGIRIATDLRCDLLVEGLLVVELKAVATILPIHQAQLLTYMRLLRAPKGLLLNFNSVNLFKDGQKTFVNDIYRNLPEE